MTPTQRRVVLGYALRFSSRQVLGAVAVRNDASTLCSWPSQPSQGAERYVHPTFDQFAVSNASVCPIHIPFLKVLSRFA